MEENNPVRDIYQDPNASQAKALVRYTFRPSESWGSSLWAVVYDHQGFMGLHVDIEKVFMSNMKIRVFTIDQECP